MVVLSQVQWFNRQIIHTVPSMHNGSTTDTAGEMEVPWFYRQIIHTVPSTHNGSTRDTAGEMASRGWFPVLSPWKDGWNALHQPAKLHTDWEQWRGTLVLCGCYLHGSFVLGRDYHEVRVSSFPSLFTLLLSLLFCLLSYYIVCDVKPNTPPARRLLFTHTTHATGSIRNENLLTKQSKNTYIHKFVEI